MILHVCTLDKFIEPFYAFVKENFADCDAKHQFYINGTSDKYETPSGNNVFLAHSVKRLDRYVWLIKQMNHAEKIILHGLWDRRILELLILQPWLLKKCYWVIWGGDLYTRVLSDRTLGWWRFEILRQIAIRRFGHFVTLIKGEYKLAQKWYGANGKLHECFTYPSNIYNEIDHEYRCDSTTNILLGNSADPSNNHEEALNVLIKYSDRNIKVYCPLSYGSVEYSNKIRDIGTNLLGDKFVPITNYMSYDKYINFLSNVDIAIFAHKRQQAMGNTITLLGMGKKVFMRNDVTQWGFFHDIGIKVFNCVSIDIEPLERNLAIENSRIIKEYFSKKNLVRQLGLVFDSKQGWRNS